MDYNEQTELYLIQWEGNHNQKLVRRFNLLFPGEKLDDVSQRMERASKARQEYEATNFNDDLIEKSVIINLAAYPKKFKLGILSKLGRPVAKHEAKIVVFFVEFRMSSSKNWKKIMFMP